MTDNPVRQFTDRINKEIFDRLFGFLSNSTQEEAATHIGLYLDAIEYAQPIVVRVTKLDPIVSDDAAKAYAEGRFFSPPGENAPVERLIEEDTERKHYLMRMTVEERAAAIGAIKALSTPTPWSTPDGRPIFGEGSPHDVGEHLRRMCEDNAPTDTDNTDCTEPNCPFSGTAKTFINHTQQPVGSPSEAEIASLVTDLWKLIKPSKAAQDIRASIKLDSGKYKQSEADYIPAYVWDLVDVAAETGLSKRESVLDKEVLQELMNAYNWAHRGNNYHSRRAEEIIIESGGIVIGDRRKGEQIEGGK